MKRIAITLSLLGLLAGATPSPAAEAASTSSLGADEIRRSVLDSMDRQADPCNDFYRYACGGWIDSTQLPSDEARWVRSFSTINERNRVVVRELLEDAAANPGPAGTERQKIGDFYASCMDEEGIEKAGLGPIAPWLDGAAGVENLDSVLAFSGKLQRDGGGPLFRFGATPDFKQPDTNLLFMSQGGLGMPDRDYYVSEDPNKKELLEKYRAHVARMLELAGSPAESAATDAAAIVAFETELAQASRPRAEMRDRDKLYNKIDRPGLEQLTPKIAWAKFFAATGFPAVESINVAVPEFYQGLEKALTAAPIETLRAYLRWNVLNAAAEMLPKAFVDADFEFYGKTLRGQQEIQPRWKRCVGATNRALGEAIGKLYVEREFAGNSKQVALDMIQDVEGAFEANLPGLTWMDDTTRGRALEKERKVRNKIGYPDKWRDYSSVSISRGDFLANSVAAGNFEFDRDMKKVGQPVDKTEWLMTPQTVNAYYLSTANEIVFPAGILQPPFFHKDYPTAMNYGAVGAVMGHELTHGFDDQGRKSDGDGVLREWWQPEVAAKFEQRAQCVDDQFSSFEVEPGVHVNGKLTLGENIADLGGVKQAYDAFKAWEKRTGPHVPFIPGLTDDQLLFVSFAQVWCSKTTPEYLRNQVTTDPHSPGEFRAIGAPMNSPAFREVFGCKDGDKMVAVPTCTVW